MASDLTKKHRETAFQAQRRKYASRGDSIVRQKRQRCHITTSCCPKLPEEVWQVGCTQWPHKHGEEINTTLPLCPRWRSSSLTAVWIPVTISKKEEHTEDRTYDSAKSKIPKLFCGQLKINTISLPPPNSWLVCERSREWRAKRGHYIWEINS